MPNFLKQEHEGAGGMFFLTVSFACYIIMMWCLRLSWTSQAVAIADNLAYMTTINTTVHNYVEHKGSYNTTNPVINLRNGGSFNPLEDFNNMTSSIGIAKTKATECKVVWNGRQTSIQFGEFKTSLGITIRPHKQQSVIENN